MYRMRYISESFKCNFDFKFKNPPRVLSCIFGFELCFFKLEFKPGVPFVTNHLLVGMFVI